MAEFAYRARIEVICTACKEVRSFEQRVEPGMRPFEAVLPRGWVVVNGRPFCGLHSVMVIPADGNHLAGQVYIEDPVE